VCFGTVAGYFLLLLLAFCNFLQWSFIVHNPQHRDSIL